jgi:hypothetical protein
MFTALVAHMNDALAVDGRNLRQPCGGAGMAGVN